MDSIDGDRAGGQHRSIRLGVGMAECNLQLRVTTAEQRPLVWLNLGWWVWLSDAPYDDHESNQRKQLESKCGKCLHSILRKISIKSKRVGNTQTLHNRKAHRITNEKNLSS